MELLEEDGVSLLGGSRNGREETAAAIDAA
jgi:hypothetical protein